MKSTELILNEVSYGLTDLCVSIEIYKERLHIISKIKKEYEKFIDWLTLVYSTLKNHTKNYKGLISNYFLNKRKKSRKIIENRLEQIKELQRICQKYVDNYHLMKVQQLLALLNIQEDIEYLGAYFTKLLDYEIEKFEKIFITPIFSIDLSKTANSSCLNGICIPYKQGNIIAFGGKQDIDYLNQIIILRPVKRAATFAYNENNCADEKIKNELDYMQGDMVTHHSEIVKATVHEDILYILDSEDNTTEYELSIMLNNQVKFVKNKNLISEHYIWEKNNKVISFKKQKKMVKTHYASTKLIDSKGKMLINFVGKEYIYDLKKTIEYMYIIKKYLYIYDDTGTITIWDMQTKCRIISWHLGEGGFNFRIVNNYMMIAKRSKIYFYSFGFGGLPETIFKVINKELIQKLPKEIGNEWRKQYRKISRII